ncbi:MAG: redox-regulated ATPase YchF [Actinomycetota bacterium]|nr:redox-regulated ATPase YchF [Actinomycetota bacterium]
MERLGLVGLPNAGKSSLFNALTTGHALVASHPFSTTETSSGVARVPDHRLDALAVMSKSRKVVHATIEVVDIAGLVAGSSTGEGLGNRFLGGLREADGLCFVLRAFDDAEIPGETDPVAALEVLELELVLADAAAVDVQLDKRRRAAKADKGAARGAARLEAFASLLGEGTPLYRAPLSDEERAEASGLFLLTAKPVIAVVNIGEDDVERAPALVAEVAAALQGTRSPSSGAADGETPAGGDEDAVVAAPVRLEAEAAQVDEAERDELREGLGLGEGVLLRAARAAYHRLGRRTFLTTGDKESRAWTFREGSTAPECAGVIHSDLQRGFIRAEVIRWDELLEIGSWAAAKAAGRLRVEGKDYVVVDGDVLEIRFNV